MKKTITLCLTAGLLGWAASVSADVLELKNGQVLTGKYVGGTAGAIRFETGSGTQVIETAQALALPFAGGGASTAAPANSPASAPAPAAAATSAVFVPAGTTLLVRMMDGASSDDTKGKRFTTTLETDLGAGGETGIMTFIVNQQGRVYQKDPGPQTAKTVGTMKPCDPDKTWTISPDQTCPWPQPKPHHL